MEPVPFLSWKRPGAENFDTGGRFKTPNKDLNSIGKTTERESDTQKTHA